MEFELTGPAQKSTKRGAAAANTAANPAKADGEKPSSSTSRRSLAGGNGTSAASTPKDVIPGTSSFSVRPEDTNGSTSGSRKRKQPPSGANSHHGGSNSAKKIFTSAPGDPSGQNGSSLVSFEKHGPILRGGKLTADDGTTYAVNGMG